MAYIEASIVWKDSEDNVHLFQLTNAYITGNVGAGLDEDLQNVAEKKILELSPPYVRENVGILNFSLSNEPWNTYQEKSHDRQ